MQLVFKSVPAISDVPREQVEVPMRTVASNYDCFRI